VSVPFTPPDHVTEREPGPWRDCTFAAVLETLRLALPNGRAISSAHAEVERFRAEAGFVDNHAGATIPDTLPAAKRLYGLSDDDYVLSGDWPTIERVLTDPDMVAVVTGMMSAVTTHMRRWSPSFLGAHAVAARGAAIPTWCDPLAPHATYRGEPVTLPTWRAFFRALPDARALLMAAHMEPEMIRSRGAVAMRDGTAVLLKRVRITVDTPLLESPGGRRLATAPKDRTYPYVGVGAGSTRAVFVDTPKPYPDGVSGPTVLYVAASAVGPLEDAPSTTGTTNSATVTLQITGHDDYVTKV
jgi:hypothetical protein